MYIVTREKLVEEDFEPTFLAELNTVPNIEVPIGEYLYTNYTNSLTPSVTSSLTAATNITTLNTNLYTIGTLRSNDTLYMNTIQQYIGDIEASSVTSDTTNYVTTEFLELQQDYIKNIFNKVNTTIYETVVEHHSPGEYVTTDDITYYSGQWVEEVELEGGFKLWRKL